MRIYIPFIGSFDLKKTLLWGLYFFGSFQEDEQKKEITKLKAPLPPHLAEDLIREYTDSSHQTLACRNSLTFIANALNPLDTNIIKNPIAESKIDGIEAEVYQYLKKDNELEINYKKVLSITSQ